MVEGKTFGEFFKAQRIALGKTLREFCLEHNLDAGNISKLERGVLLPPQAEGKLKQYAKYLNIKEGGDSWYEFFDLAAAEAGKLPGDFCETSIMARMPILFRTIRGKKLSKGKIDKLIKIIKES